jgi:hypothetical protein
LGRVWGVFEGFRGIFERFLGDCEGKNEKWREKFVFYGRYFIFLRGKIGGDRIKRQKFYYYL